MLPKVSCFEAHTLRYYTPPANRLCSQRVYATNAFFTHLSTLHQRDFLSFKFYKSVFYEVVPERPYPRERKKTVVIGEDTNNRTYRVQSLCGLNLHFTRLTHIDYCILKRQIKSLFWGYAAAAAAAAGGNKQYGGANFIPEASIVGNKISVVTSECVFLKNSGCF